MTRASVNPELLHWARERAGWKPEDLAQRFPKLAEWEAGTRQPTLKQVDAFASSVHVPVGYLFFSEPPFESIPIPDYRTVVGKPVSKPTPDLLDTIWICQERQSWYQDFAREEGLEALSFIASETTASPPERVAARMRETLNFSVEARRKCQTWTESLRIFVDATDRAGVLVMVNGIVGSNTHRRLNPEEFRGFALSDQHAPLVFINGTDTKAAQMFTLAHELAHLWLGESALSDCEATPASGLGEDEVWCNAVAAEFLVPLAELRDELRETEPVTKAVTRLARVFKVSSLVVLRRLLDIGWLDRMQFEDAWHEEIQHLRSKERRDGGGGDFYRTTLSRVGKRFAQALVTSTLEGRTLYRDAYYMLGIRRGDTFEEFARQVIPGS